MEKAKGGIRTKILIGVVVVGAAWLALQMYRQTARIDELAALPSCKLAAEYASWRLAFEGERGDAEPTGAAAEEFVQQNELFERAVRRALEDRDSVVLESLEDLTAVDSARWIREPGNIDAFVRVMLAECPEEIEALMREVRR